MLHLDQVGDQRLVGRRHLVVAKLVRPDPGELLSLLGLNDALPAPANIERHQEMEIRIGVARKGKRREARLPDDNAEFLLHLPDQRFLGPFAGLDLAARKLPKARHCFSRGAFGEQHAPIGIDQGAGGNKNEFDAHWPGPDRRQALVKGGSSPSNKFMTSPRGLIRV
jgi:hypothetical protein